MQPYGPPLVCRSAGGKPTALERAAGGKPQKMSRKERVKLKKAQKRQERAAGSDDDDLGTGGPAFQVHLLSRITCQLPQGMCHCAMCYMRLMPCAFWHSILHK